MAEKLRLASWNIALDREGPGLLLRDILTGSDPQIEAIAHVASKVRPDVLVVQKMDYDHDLAALRALRDRLAESGARYDHVFALHPNSGMATGQDMDGDGRLGGDGDAQGFGAFSGQGGMAILSTYPIDRADVQDYSALLWRDLPGAIEPVMEGRPFPSAEAAAIRRLSSIGHWVIPLKLPSGRLDLLIYHATPPVFDGPEDLNGRRNHDENRFWQVFLDGAFGPSPKARFVLVGDANLDPMDSDGRREAIAVLLGDPRLQDPRPMRPGPVEPASGKMGDPRLHTVHWPAPGPGGLRVSYILPSADLAVVDSSVHWPPEGTVEGDMAAMASHHRMVWVDLEIE